MSQPVTKEFGKWRSFFWPVHTFELKKFLPMFLLFFFINFNYTILRDTKDTLIVTAPGSGAEAIPFLKGMGRSSVRHYFHAGLFQAQQYLEQAETVYVDHRLFWRIFHSLCYCFFILSANHFIRSLLPIICKPFCPKDSAGLIAIIRNWTYSTFYIMAELWGSVAISLLFWGFANDTTKVSESKRFYALFGLGANLAMYPSGFFVKKFAQLRDVLPANVDAWGVTLNYTLTAVVIACALRHGRLLVDQ